jgi:hypothetical protein
LLMIMPSSSAKCSLASVGPKPMYFSRSNLRIEASFESESFSFHDKSIARLMRCQSSN